MYGALLPVTGIAIGLYLVVAIVVVIVGSLMKLRGGREKS